MTKRMPLFPTDKNTFPSADWPTDFKSSEVTHLGCKDLPTEVISVSAEGSDFSKYSSSSDSWLGLCPPLESQKGSLFSVSITPP